jgi:hypothetical protein
MVLFHDFAWNRCAVGWDEPSRIDESSDTEMSMVTDDSPELASASINNLVFGFCLDIASIMAEVSHLGAPTDIDVIPDDRVPDIGKVRNRG